MKAISDFIRYLRIMDGIATSDIIGWVLAALAGFIAYKLIDNMQTSIERHNMLASVENSISAIFDSKNAFIIRHGEGPSPKEPDKNRVMVRSVLHDKSPWQVIRSVETGEIEYMIIDSQRYIHIRHNDETDDWISTQALHELLLKFRRIEKMYKSGIVKKIDLADLSREILPFGVSGRLEFFYAYYDEYDAECMAFLLMNDVICCNKYRNSPMVNYFRDYYNSHPAIHRFFSAKNRRFSRVRGILAEKAFNRIMK